MEPFKEQRKDYKRILQREWVAHESAPGRKAIDISRKRTWRF